MAFTPDQPFPKSPGNPIMAKDWNDAIGEVQRLDTAKVNRAGADSLAGPLTIANALAVGTTTAAAAGARLHVVDTANPAVARLQTTAVNGSARLELWSDPRTPAGVEWRPGYIESFDTGSFTGGLRFVTNGTGAAAKQGNAEQLRLVNGTAGFGVADPAFRIDALGPIRSRQNGGITPGVWLSGTTVTNRAFFGLLSDNVAGILGAGGAGWALQMSVVNGNLGIKTSPGTAALTVSGDSQLNGNANITGDANVLGNAGFGLSSVGTGVRMDVNGRLRLREGGGTAGLWLYAATPAADRGFIGMLSDTQFGLWGGSGGGWGLVMDTGTGNVMCNGRLWSNNVHTEATASALTSTTSTSYVQIANMVVVFTLVSTRPCFFNFLLPGVEVNAPSSSNWSVAFRLTLDGVEIAHTEPFFIVRAGDINSRHVDLTRLMSVAAGTHTLRAEWCCRSAGMTVYGCSSSGGADRVLQVIEF